MIKTLATMVLAGGLVVGSQMPDYSTGITGIKPLDENTIIMHSHGEDGACKYNSILICGETKNAWAIYDIQKDRMYLDNDRDGDIDNIIQSPRMTLKSLMPKCQ